MDKIFALLIFLIIAFFVIGIADDSNGGDYGSDYNRFKVKARALRSTYNSQEQYYINKAKRHELINRSWGRGRPIGYGEGFYGRDVRFQNNRKSYTGSYGPRSGFKRRRR